MDSDSKVNNTENTEETQGPSLGFPSQDDVLEQGPYVDGFSKRTVLGALFVAFVMMPGSIYLGLVAGQTLGSAAEWVTIILFAEIARRSFANLKRQEVFILFYVASSIAAVAIAHLALSGGPFAGAIWNQYLVQSPQTSTISNQIPDWVVPPASSDAIQNRDLAHRDWFFSASRGLLGPFVLCAIGYVLGRFSWFGLGYIVFRATSDIERLPFPLAPIAAEGATALAESTDRDDGVSKGKRSWRWNVFSIGASCGVVFGCLYVLLPVISGLFLAKPIMIFPIPFIDFTSNVESVLPASMISLSFDIGGIFAGMILPYPLVIGCFTSILCTGVFGNPILLKLGAFKHWTPGNGLLVNQMILSFDFWMSVSIGLAGAIALLGIGNMLKAFFQSIRKKDTSTNAVPRIEFDSSGIPYRKPSKERGDFPMWVAAGLFIISTAGFAWISHVLVPDFPVWIILIFGFLWTPLHSYISARLVGLTGGGLGTPFLKETVFITSGYTKVDIWFAPIPLFDHGGMAQRFRELELTRTKFTSLFKAELLMFPIVFASSFVFWWFFWKMNQIPSDAFPFAARMWPVAARQAYLIFTANSTGQSLLLQALNVKTILISFGVGMSLYGLMTWFGLPVLFFYGILGGVGGALHGGLPLIIGALLNRYYFSPKFGKERWARYVPVLAAGFSCGMGLAGMTAVGFSLVAQCAKDLPF